MPFQILGGMETLKDLLMTFFAFGLEKASTFTPADQFSFHPEPTCNPIKPFLSDTFPPFFWVGADGIPWRATIPGEVGGRARGAELIECAPRLWVLVGVGL